MAAGLANVGAMNLAGVSGWLRAQFSGMGTRKPDPADWRRSRPFCLALVTAGFFLVNSRSLSWGWLGLDDYRFIVANPNLGHGWASVSWGLTDVQYGHRWTPIVWLVACLCGVPTAFKFHLLVFVLGLVLCLLVTEIYGRGLGHGWVLPAALLFALSPMRNEVFTWGMGFVYETVALFLCLAWLQRRNTWMSGLWVLLALVTYPQAAGAVVAYCWVHRRHASGWVLGFLFAAFAAYQYHLRETLGVIAWHHDYHYLLITLPHYALNLFVPFATVPLFPSLYYPLLWVGGALIILAAIVRPRAVGLWVLLFAPTLAASVTEGFWFGARYCLIPSIAAYGWLAYEASALRSRLALPALWAAVAGFCFLNLTDVGMSRGLGLCARVASQEAALVGIDFDLVRTLKMQPPPRGSSVPAVQPVPGNGP